MTSSNELRREHGAASARVAASVKTVALRIAHNVGLRHALRRPRWAEEVEVADPSPGASARLLAQGEADRLHAAIRTLPLAQRQVITLALEELTHELISETLGISENAVATRLHRAAGGRGGGLRRMRRTARAADTLLLGSPADLARGHRQHLHLRLCALRSTSAVVVSVSPIPLYLGLAAAGRVPWLVAGVSAVGWAGVLAWLHLRTAPRLQAEVARLDALIAELAG